MLQASPTAQLGFVLTGAGPEDGGDGYEGYEGYSSYYQQNGQAESAPAKEQVA